MSVVSMTTLLTIWLTATPELGTVNVDSGAVSTTVTQNPKTAPPQRWLTSYSEASALAARHKLPLLLHFDAPWCGACRQMEQNVLQKPGVTSLLGTKVIGVRLNADYNKTLIAEFGISSLPTEVVVMADGSRGSRYAGAASLSTYISRLNTISGSNTAIVSRSAAKPVLPVETQNLRACLIVKRDGKMVGLGGYSPVTFKTKRAWKRGSEEFVAQHEGVCYYLESASDVSRFKANPDYYIPQYHGCDLVELSQENRALPGAIEYGAFYNDQIFFFASLENRQRFEQNPKWFLAAATDAYIENEDGFPFLKTASVNN